MPSAPREEPELPVGIADLDALDAPESAQVPGGAVKVPLLFIDTPSARRCQGLNNLSVTSAVNLRGARRTEIAPRRFDIPGI